VSSGLPPFLSRLSRQRATSKRDSLAVAHSIVERAFTPDGKKAFTKRVLEVAAHMRASDFEPQKGELSRSYETPRRPSGRCVGTAFWVRRA